MDVVVNLPGEECTNELDRSLETRRIADALATELPIIIKKTNDLIALKGESAVINVISLTGKSLVENIEIEYSLDGIPQENINIGRDELIED